MTAPETHKLWIIITQRLHLCSFFLHVILTLCKPLIPPAELLLALWLHCLDWHRLAYVWIRIPQNNLAAHINSV